MANKRPKVRTELSTEKMFKDATGDFLELLKQRRAEYEAIHGPVDLSRRYVTEHELSWQAACAREDPEGYIEDLPPFFADVLRDQFDRTRKTVGLDEVHEDFIPVAMLLLREKPSP